MYFKNVSGQILKGRNKIRFDHSRKFKSRILKVLTLKSCKIAFVKFK